MNEVELIRAQLTTERQHAGAVAQVCAATLGAADPAALASGSPLEEFRHACVDYLVCVLAWFEERDRRLGHIVNGLGPEHPHRDALDEALTRRGRSRDALEKLEAAFAHGAGEGPAGEAQRVWGEFAQYFSGAWSTRRDTLDALLGSNARAGDWRAFSGIDADSILEERTRFARVHATVPRGTQLPVSGAKAGGR